MAIAQLELGCVEARSIALVVDQNARALQAVTRALEADVAAGAELPGRLVEVEFVGADFFVGARHRDVTDEMNLLAVFAGDGLRLDQRLGRGQVFGRRVDEGRHATQAPVLGREDASLRGCRQQACKHEEPQSEQDEPENENILSQYPRAVNPA